MSRARDFLTTNQAHTLTRNCVSQNMFLRPVCGAVCLALNVFRSTGQQIWSSSSQCFLGRSKGDGYSTFYDTTARI